jgi:uncharacterized protein
MEGVGLLVITFFLSFSVHVWSTLVGGGGAIIIPALLFLGFSPQAAIATNRVGALSNIFALFQFHRHGEVKWRVGLWLAAFAGIGSAIGSLFLLHLEADVLERGIGVIILLSLPMFLLKPKAGLKEKKVKRTKLKHAGGGVIMFFLGIIGGFFSATGVWFSYVYIFYYGMTFLQTAATRKIAGMFMLTFSLAILIPAGIINWPVAISMFAGGALGSWISAKYAKKLGNEWVRYLFLFVMFLMALKILLF